MAPPTDDHLSRQSAWGDRLLWGLLIGTLLFLFAPAIAGQRVLVFRDAAYWHLNTLQWTAERWQSGQIPLWNDLQGLGTNWVGQGTTSVFYPGTWLLAWDVGHFRQRYAFVLVLHLVWAALGLWRLARGMQLGSTAATLAALSYTLSGPVLVQHANWPFLISATWLPWALWGLWRSWVDGCQTGGLVAAAAVALMILGGEPQAAGCWLLAAIALAVVAPRRPPTSDYQGRGPLGYASRLSGPPAAVPSPDAVPSREAVPAPAAVPQWPTRLGPIAGRGLLVGCSRLIGVIGLGLAASCVQWWPTWEAADSSTRGLRERPQNLYQVTAEWIAPTEEGPARGGLAALLAPPLPNSQADQALQFSQPPWHWITLVVGNFWGTWSSVHARWDRHLVANDRVWNPTLYAGAATAVLALSLLGRTVRQAYRSLRLGRIGRRRLGRVQRSLAGTDAEASWRTRRHQHGVSWLVAMLFFFGLASCGWYGAVWLSVELQQVWGGTVRTPIWGPQVGGLYWLMSIGLPGFDQFRYPAKLWLLAALAWPLLAAHEWERVFSSGRVFGRRPVQAQRRVALTATLVLMGLGVVWGILVSPLFVDAFYRHFQAVAPDPWLGILQLPQALLETHLAVVHSMVVVGLLLVGIGRISARAANPADDRRARPRRLWPGLALGLLTLGDLGLSNGWLIQMVDHRVLTDRTIWETDTSPYRQAVPTTRSLAQQRFLHDPNLFQQHRWDQMQQKWGPYWGVQPTEKLTWQAIYSMRATGTPQFHLPLGVPVLNAEQTLEPSAATLLRIAAAELAHEPSPTGGESVWHSYLRSQGVRYWLSGAPDPTRSGPAWGGLQWRTLPRTPPAVWVAETWSVIPLPDARRPEVLKADLLRHWFDGHQFLDCPLQVVVDSPPQFPATTIADEGEGLRDSGLLEWRLDEQKRSATVRLAQPAVLVWRQTHDSGWWCVIKDRQGHRRWVSTIPVQRYLTGVAVPAGESEVELVYLPGWFWLGGPLSVFAWCCLIVSLVRRSLSAA